MAAAHLDDHESDEHLIAGHDDSDDGSDFSQDMVHHHSYPAAIEVAGIEVGRGETQSQVMQPLGRAVRLTSLEHAPPIEPPAA